MTDSITLLGQAEALLRRRPPAAVFGPTALGLAAAFTLRDDSTWVWPAISVVLVSSVLSLVAAVALALTRRPARAAHVLLVWYRANAETGADLAIDHSLEAQLPDAVDPGDPWAAFQLARLRYRREVAVLPADPPPELMDRIDALPPAARQWARALPAVHRAQLAATGGQPWVDDLGRAALGVDAVRDSVAFGRPTFARWGAIAAIALLALIAGALAWPPPAPALWPRAADYGVMDQAPLPGRAPTAVWERMSDAVALLSSHLASGRVVGSARLSDLGTWLTPADGPILQWSPPPGAHIAGVPDDAPRRQVFVPLGAFLATGNPTVCVEWGPLGTSTVVTLEIDPALIQQALDWVYPVQ